jgi:hypothetical protein
VSGRAGGSRRLAEGEGLGYHHLGWRRERVLGIILGWRRGGVLGIILSCQRERVLGIILGWLRGRVLGIILRLRYFHLNPVVVFVGHNLQMFEGTAGRDSDCLGFRQQRQCLQTARWWGKVHNGDNRAGFAVRSEEKVFRRTGDVWVIQADINWRTTQQDAQSQVTLKSKDSLGGPSISAPFFRAHTLMQTCTYALARARTYGVTRTCVGGALRAPCGQKRN